MTASYQNAKRMLVQPSYQGNNKQVSPTAKRTLQPHNHSSTVVVALPPCGIRDNLITRKRPLESKHRLLCNLRKYYAKRRSVEPSPVTKIPTSRCRRSLPVRIPQPRQRTLRFQSQVKVHKIPHREDYSEEDRRALWTSRKELKKLVLKNHAEFAWEGRDWRKCPEEDQFTLLENGERQHPMYAKRGTKRGRFSLPTAKKQCVRPVSSDTALSIARSSAV